MDKYEKMKRPELAALCRKHGLSDEGSASVLRKRIRYARDAAKARREEPEPETDAPAAQEAVKELPAPSPGEDEGEPETGGNDHEDGPDGSDTPDDERTHEVALTFGDDTYFGDSAWEAANLSMVEKRATDAGHNTIGRARRLSVEGNTVTYRVRVE